jgi:DNA polymerase-3 subunit delta
LKAKVILLYGDQPLLLEEELEKLKRSWSRKGDISLNLQVFEAGETPFSEVLEAAEVLPFGSERRYLVVKGAQALTPSEVRQLERYLDQPAEETVLVLLAEGLREGSPLLRALQSKGMAKKVERRRDKIPLWIKERFAERGLKVDGRAAVYMAEALGNDLLALEKAVDKVAQYHQGRDAVGLEEVVDLVTPREDYQVYEIVERVGTGDADGSLRVLRRWMARGGSTTHLLRALSLHFRQLLLYHALSREGYPDAEIARRMDLGSQAWRLDRYLRRHAAVWDLESTARALFHLASVEADLKTGGLGEDTAAEFLVLGLLSLLAGTRTPRCRARGERKE